MEFKLTEKQKGSWENMMVDLEVESQLTGDGLNRLHSKRAAEQAENLKKHLEYLEKHGFKTADEFINYIMAGNRVVPQYGDYKEGIEYLTKPEDFWKGYDGGPMFRIRTTEYNDIDMPIGVVNKYKTVEEFRKWVEECLCKPEQMDHGYIPVWRKILC